ncbi:class I SAM-dependent methyltransferase [bacterium]|nr:class I SAM-dependent methyltransferase [bacterium]
MQLLERLLTVKKLQRSTDGLLELPDALYRQFLSSPFDVMPDFKAPPGFKHKNGRGKNHPRYGRFIYAFGKYFKPEIIVEVGTYAGGTSIGWARAIAENGCGKLICVDNDSYSKGTYPEITKINIENTNISPEQYELLNGDAKEIIPQLSTLYKGKVDIYLVDGDHTYEGALADLENGLPMMKSGGHILVHDVDRNRKMSEATAEHPFPVYEAMMEFVENHKLQWCILKFIRKHLAVILV